jgi:Ca-activated chloride channel homolog
MRRSLLALTPILLAACGAERYADMATPSRATSIAAAPSEAPGTEQYTDYGVNPETLATKDHLSTFAIDVDTASYTISRRKIREGSLPPFQAVRAEEYINFFDYGYAPPTSGPFAVDVAAAPSPFAQGHEIVRVGIQGKRVTGAERKHVHLVYLVDTSGSMDAEDRIGLAKKSLRLLTDTLKPGDTVALCTYAGSVREVLKPTGTDQKAKILAAIDDLTASGSTAMSSGIELAYKLASQTAVSGEVSRVVVLSDGDANVGNTSHEEILKSIAQYKDKGITLSTVGFGSGNYKDTMMEQLADKGDGNYVYIDSEEQARHVFGEATEGLLQVIARDVKVQVDFDPDVVKTYRLVGYENRDVADKDFRNDKIDGGEVGAGHSVTALYDVVLLPNATKTPLVVRLRYKGPDGGQATEQAFPMNQTFKTFAEAPSSLRFATAVATFADVLRQSPYVRDVKLAEIARVANGATDDQKDRKELVALIGKANELGGGEKALAKY